MRNGYGCEDTISTVEGREVRHCNWVRFLKTCDVIDDANVVGVKIKGEIVYQTIKTILPNEEIVAYLQRTDENLEDVFRPAEETVTPDLSKGKKLPSFIRSYPEN